MKNQQKHEKSGYLLGLLSSIAFALYVLINKYVYSNYVVDSFDYTVTFMISGSIIALVSIMVGYTKTKATPTQKSSFGLAAFNGLLASIGLGVFVFGQAYTSSINASILGVLTAIPTAFFGYFLLKERLTKTQLLWFTILCGGLYLAIVGINSLQLNRGDVIIIGSCVLLGFTNNLSKIVMKKGVSGINVADIRLITGGVLFFGLGLLFHKNELIVTTAGFLPLVSGFFFWLTIRFFYAAIESIGPNRAIVLANSHPAFAPVVGAVLLNERYTIYKALGAVIILISIYRINNRQSIESPKV